MTTNPATRWMEMGMFDEQVARDTPAGAYLWRLTTKLFRCFRHPEAMFNLAMDEDNQQLIALGTSCLHTEDRPGRLPLNRACPITSITIEEGPDGDVDTVDRVFELSAIKAIDKWGDRLPKQVLDMASAPGTAHDMVEFLHVNCPRSEREYGKRDRRNMPYRSVYLCLLEPHIIVDGGSHELEYTVSRWRKRSKEIYGRGCGHKALGDIDVLQRLNRVTLLAGERTIDPPILSPTEGVTGPLSFKARAINSVRPEYLANGAHPRAMITNTRVDIGLELINDRRELVRRSFLKQLIEIGRAELAKATATHVLAVQEEQTRGFAPVLGRQENERLSRIVGRHYNILRRMPGVFEPAPPEIAGQPLQPNFDSPAAKGMRMGVARAIAQAFELAAPIIKATGDDALWDNFELDESLREIGSGTGMPAFALKPVEARDAMRQARQQVAAERAALENQKDATVAVKNVAPMAQVIASLFQGAGGAGAPAGAPA